MFNVKPTILCIDDNHELLFILERWLSADGFKVITAQNCASAIKCAGESQPDLILQDVLMPDMSGYDCCRQLQEIKELALVPVIFLTALEGEKDKAKALAAGGVDFLTKPVTREQLLQTVQRHLAAREQWSTRLGDRRTQIVDIRGFMAFLLNTLRVPHAERARFQGLSPAMLYAMAPELGLDATHIARHMAAFAQVPFTEQINRAEVELGALPAAFCRAHQVVALNNETDGRHFVLSNPLDLKLHDDLKNLFGEKPQIIATTPAAIAAVLDQNTSVVAAPIVKPATKLNNNRAIPVLSIQQLESELSKKYSNTPSEETVLTEDISEESAPIIQMVNKIINNAIDAGASDIHVEPGQNDVVVRYRIDGELRIVNRLRPQKLCLPLCARLKIMSQLDITEKRLPQDGRVAFNDNVDLRVASCPMQYGEKIVLRILDKKKAALPLDQLGFSERNLSVYREKMQTPYGMILHVGPTGSGKSMSLFSALREVQKPDINIQTIEDPIEYTLPGISQMQVHPEIGLTFQRALRSFLRQDPDVILVGEIRDRETANAAVEASLTGHMLFSTLHTNDAASTVVRLLEMGVEPYMVSSSLVMVCAQRLLRRLCDKCKVCYEATPGEKSLAGVPVDQPLKLFRAKGCPHCNGTGYKGRIGVHELLVLDDNLRASLGKKGITADELKRQAVESGMTTLYWDAMEKARQGITTVQEVIANIRRDDFDSRPAWMQPPAAAQSSRNLVASIDASLARSTEATRVISRRSAKREPEWIHAAGV